MSERQKIILVERSSVKHELYTNIVPRIGEAIRIGEKVYLVDHVSYDYEIGRQFFNTVIVYLKFQR